MAGRRSCRCSICGRIVFEGQEHWCPPAFRIWCPERGETGDDATLTHGIDAKTAAEKWAERDDAESVEYTIVCGDAPIVIVMRDQDFQACDVDVDAGTVTFGDRRVWRFKLTGETVVQYHARLVSSEGVIR